MVELFERMVALGMDTLFKLANVFHVLIYYLVLSSTPWKNIKWIFVALEKRKEDTFGLSGHSLHTNEDRSFKEYKYFDRYFKEYKSTNLLYSVSC